MSYPTTTAEFLKTLKKAASVPTKYWNQFPYNLGYMHSDGVVSFDCVNLVKAILNGWQYSKTIGSFCRTLSRTGDCDEWGLLQQCTSVSQDFSKLCYLAILYLPGHIGTYLGENVVINGKTYNTIECTAAWGGGVLYSYTTSNGSRYNHKGGTRNGAWTHHGKMTKWLKYGDTPKPTPTPTDKKTVTYRAYDKYLRKWLPAVTSTTAVADTAGIKGDTMGALAVKASKGTVTYCVHDQYNGWLPAVTGYNINDANKGFAGDYKAIDGVAIKSSSIELLYRVKLHKSQKWLPWVSSKNYNPKNEDTGMAGIIGQYIDEIEIKVK